MNKNPDRPVPSVDSCPTVRLAGSEFAAVDRCSCGTLRVHLGALTLRISPEGLAAVMQTLGEALANNAGLQMSARALDTTLSAGKAPRGQS
jgi:hypothetical protein